MSIGVIVALLGIIIMITYITNKILATLQKIKA